ncbi:hypothetical protein O6H91_Y149800 [Diphasiastrum complanatum]|nr:hypothetical protein O6H91_Y149800 [Diphasiastrum complanatum]
MLEGKPPFRGTSEYITFQKVMAREFMMPPHFTPEAQDLVDHLLDLDPERRIAAVPMGYDALKAHPFFSRVKWSQLRELTPPRLAIWAPEQAAEAESEESADSNWDLTQIGRKLSITMTSRVPTLKSGHNLGECISEGDGKTASTSTHYDKNSLSQGCNALRWKEFLNKGETLVATSLVKKYRGLSIKRRQLMLTNKPRLLYINPVKLVLKGEIPWSHDLYVLVENEYKFTICTPKRNYNLEDVKGKAYLWKEAIEHFLGCRGVVSYSVSKQGLRRLKNLEL